MKDFIKLKERVWVWEKEPGNLAQIRHIYEDGVGLKGTGLTTIVPFEDLSPMTESEKIEYAKHHIKHNIIPMMSNFEIEYFRNMSDEELNEMIEYDKKSLCVQK